MKKLAIVYDEIFLTHKPPFSHPESPTRLVAIIDKLNEESFFEDVDLLQSKMATEENILLVHTKSHLEYVHSSIRDNKLLLEPDTYAVKESWNAALTAAGSIISAIDLVLTKKYSSSFCAVRPPGHHAKTNRPMGFCLFNNVAIGAKYALSKYKLDRVAIIDWDVHHGNGTQEIFYNSPEVYYFSLHQYPFYPGTGSENEKGDGKGKNHTMNFPLPAYTSGEAYLKIFKEKIIPELNSYKPQLIIISAGFDAHKDDPLAYMLLVENDYSEMTKILKQFTSSENIPIISALEGGYNLNALANSVYEHLKVLNS
jgi:acetoin utilization deacetylase AcuC-like enzyme